MHAMDSKMSFDGRLFPEENAAAHSINPVTRSLSLTCVKRILSGGIMKLNSSVVTINANVGKRHFAQSAAPVGRNRLDTLGHGLLVAAGIALNVAAATQGLMELRATGIDRAQFVGKRGAEIPQIAERAAPTAAKTARELPQPPQIGA
jgi:hypothetical protein